MIACSIVPGLPDWVPGLTKPLTGRPDCDIGLIPWEVELPWPAVPGFLNDVPGLATCRLKDTMNNIDVKLASILYAKLIYTLYNIMSKAGYFTMVN